jgi:hypothetical protein
MPAARQCNILPPACSPALCGTDAQQQLEQLALYGVYAYTCRNGAVWYTPADKNAVCTLSVVMRSRTETGEARTARMAARNRPPRALLLTRDDPLRDKVRLAPRVRQPEPNL